MKKIVSFILILSIILGIMPLGSNVFALSEDTLWDGSVATSFNGGTGTANNPYQINTAEQLAYLASKVNSGTSYSGKYFILTADICINNYDNYDTWEKTAPKNNWTPIGISSSACFEGTFDGNGHCIQGLYVKRQSWAGLFGSIKDATIKNLAISNAYIAGSTAGVVARAYASDYGYITLIENVSFSGTVSATSSYIGGICARYVTASGSSCIVSNCSVYGTIAGVSNVGGISGSNVDIKNCYVNANITGTDSVGGIAGSGGTVTDCVAYGQVNGNTQVGGIIGYKGGGYNIVAVSGCANYSTVTGTSKVGGIMGAAWSGPVITECFNAGTVTGQSRVAGIAGYVSTAGGARDCYNTGNVVGIGSKQYIAGIVGHCEYNGAGATNCYNVGTVTSGSAICASTAYGGVISKCYYLEGVGTSGGGTALSKSAMCNASSFSSFDFNTIWTMNKVVGRPVLLNTLEKMPDASCQVTVLDKATGERLVGAIVEYNGHLTVTSSAGIATITAPGQDYTSANYITVKKAGYNNFVCYLSDLSVSYDMLLNNTILLVPTEGIDDEEAANNIYLNEHISFYLSNYGSITKDYGFDNVVWKYEDGKRLWACYTWDIVGDVGEVLTLKFDELTISADYYDLYVADLILALVEAQTVEDEALYTKAADVYQDCYSAFTDNFVTNLVAIIEEDDLIQEELENLLKAENIPTPLKELLTDKKQLKSDLGEILQGKKTGVSTGMKIIYETVCGKALTDEALFSQLFSGFSAVNEIASIYTDTIDVIQDVGNACIIAESCVAVNKDIFRVLSKAAFAMENSSYALRLLDSIKRYEKIATDEDAFRRYIVFEAESELVSAAYKYAFQDIIKAEMYKVVSSAFNIGIPQLKALVGTYNGTYKLLDRITKLSSKTEQYYIMNYVAPVEAALSQVVMDSGDKMVISQDYESARYFDLAYQALRFTNKYLYESAYNFAALQKDAEEMHYATYYKNAWNLNNCHDRYVIDRSKYISVQCPGDVYLYDDNGELIVAIVNEEVVTYTDNQVTVSVCDGVKSISLPADKDYGMEIQATDAGTMTVNYTVGTPEVSDPERVVVFDGVELNSDSSFNFYMGSDGDGVSLIDQNQGVILPDLDTAELTFKGASLTLQHNLAVNYKVDKALFENVGYTTPYVVFELNGVRTTVSSYTIDGNRYVFTFCNIAPNQMNDVIYATLYATYDGQLYSSTTREYSVAEYCYSMLELCSGDEYAELRTLLVDLLNYGAVSQQYTDYNVSSLVNANLTEDQKLWATRKDPTLGTVLDTTYEVVENPTATWKGVGLVLNEAVSMRLKFTAENIDGLTVKVKTDTNEWAITSDKFLEENGVYYVYFNGLHAGQMRETLYLTICNGNTVVSNTVCYSIESYAYEKQTSNITYLADLVKAMMKYGDSAYVYAN